jgi:hypothetical protein
VLLLDGVSVVFVVAVNASWWSYHVFHEFSCVLSSGAGGKVVLNASRIHIILPQTHQKQSKLQDNHHTYLPPIHPSTTPTNPHPPSNSPHQHPKNAQRRFKTQRPPLPSTPPWRLQMGQHTRPSLCNPLPHMSNPPYASPDIPDLPQVRW